MLTRLANWCYERRRRVLALWAALLVTASIAAAVGGGDHRFKYEIPRSDSSEAVRVFEDRLPQVAGGAIDVVYRADKGVADPAVAARITRLAGELKAAPHVVAIDPGPTSADGTTGMMTVHLDKRSEEMPVAATDRILAATSAANGAGLQVEAGGFAVQNAESKDASSESIGLLAAAVILLLAFGSVLAMGLPIAVAVFALGVALGGVALIANVLVVPDFAVMLATMIGIGVGIDYALFVLNRYRTALANGATPHDAVVEAVTTAGRAVLFAGTTVVIAMFGLVFMGLDYLWGVAASTSLAVLVVMVASLTLLPALLGFAGRAIDRLQLPWLRHREARDPRTTLPFRWSRVVQTRPWAAAIASLVVLVALAAPFTNLRFGMPDAGNGAKDLTSRRAYDLARDGFGPGTNGPLALSVERRDAGRIDDSTLTGLSGRLAQTPGVAAVLPALRSNDGGAAMVTVIPTTGPQDKATEALVHRIRADVVPAVDDGGATRIAVGGETAMFVDESDYLSGRLPVFIGAVIMLSFLLLLVVFRSVLVAVKAALMNLLSIGAAYGVIALAASGGWFGNAIGIHESTPVPAWLPMMMFAMLFGLSMDYEVFLLSRIREEYDRTGDNAGAVADGLASTARVITAAAAIMVTVFGAFMLDTDPISKLAGLGLATAIFVDATVVRMVLVPATMELLGDRNWWLPAWLARVLPSIDVEGDRTTVEPEPELEGIAA